MSKYLIACNHAPCSLHNDVVASLNYSILLWDKCMGWLSLNSLRVGITTKLGGWKCWLIMSWWFRWSSICLYHGWHVVLCQKQSIIERYACIKVHNHLCKCLFYVFGIICSNDLGWFFLLNILLYSVDVCVVMVYGTWTKEFELAVLC